MHPRPLQSLICALPLAALAAGCNFGETEVKTTLLVGQVRSNGQPVPEGVILFIPMEGQGNWVDAKIVDGNYRAANVPLGKVKVVISAIQQGEQIAGQFEDGVRYRKIDYVPEEFKEGVERTVKPGMGDLNFDMRGKVREVR